MKDVKINPSATIIFGQNTSGLGKSYLWTGFVVLYLNIVAFLVAAYHFGLVKPEYKSNIHVISSIHETARKVRKDFFIF